MAGDPKPQAPVKDRDLLGRLKVAWSKYGCAMCGRTALPDAGLGYEIELHHVDSGSGRRPDEVGLILGLCGAFLNGCHKAVTEHRADLKENQAGIWAFIDRRQAGAVWQPCRIPPDLVELAPRADQPPRVTTRSESLVRAAQGSPNGSAPKPADSPKERFEQIRYLVTRSTRDRLATAVLLHYARKHGEHDLLGMSWTEYREAAGLDKSEASKMLAVGEVFEGKWLELSEQDQSALSLERLYQSALRVRDDEVEVGVALADAVANPTHQIVAMRKGDEPSEKRCIHCPDCGREWFHTCR